MSFPVTVGGVTYLLADFSPYGYITALTNSVASMGDHFARAIIGSVSTSFAPGTVANATQNVTMSTGLYYVPGTKVAFYASASGDAQTGLINSYNIATGVASVTFSNAFTGGATVRNDWLVMPDPGSFAGLSESSHIGSGAGIVQDTQKGIRLFQDFLMTGNVTVNPLGRLPSLWATLANHGGTFVNYSADSSSIDALLSTGSTEVQTNNPGVVGMEVSNPNTKLTVSHGQRGYNCLCGGGSTEASLVARLDVLPTDTDNFKSYVGLRGDSSSPLGNIFDAYGLGFRSSYAENSGLWVAVYTHRGQETLVFTEFDPTVWTTFHIFVNANTNVAYLYATQTGGQDREALTPVLAVNLGSDYKNKVISTLMHLAASIYKVTGFNARHLNLDLMACSKNVWRQ